MGTNFKKLDATTDEEIARQMIEDDSPELTDEQLDEGEIWEGDRFIRTVGERPEGVVTLRLDREILAHFRAGGPGWQTRLNQALRKVLDE